LGLSTTMREIRMEGIWPDERKLQAIGSPVIDNHDHKEMEPKFSLGELLCTV
jgi:hypothetical protein